MSQQKRFLIFNNGMIGNTLFNMPAAAWLKKEYPGCFVGMVVERVGLELVSNDPNVDSFHTFNKKKDGLGAQFRLVMALRREKYDVSLHLRKGVRNEVIARLAGASLRAGFRLKGSPQHLHIKMDENDSVHRLESRAEFLEAVFDTKVQLERPRLAASADAQQELDELLQKHQIKHNSYFVLHPTGDSQRGIQWTLEQYAKAVADLSPIAPVFIICMPNEQAEVEKSIPSNPNVHYYTGSIATTAALIANASVFIGNDSGPAHMACAMETPRVLVYLANPINFAKWAPADMANCKVIFSDVFSGQAVIDAVNELRNDKNESK